MYRSFLHPTRPAIEIPDREALGVASHLEAAKGAYLVRDYALGKTRGGTLIVQGTRAMISILKLLPEMEKRNLNVKIVAAGVRYTPTHVGRILRACGWSLQKPTRHARQRDEEAIRRWQEEQWPEVKKGRDRGTDDGVGR